VPPATGPSRAATSAVDRRERSPATGTASAATSAALRRVLERAGVPGLLELLSEGLEGADLTTLLLEAHRRRAARLTPATVLARYGSDRFVGPGATAFGEMRRAEDAFLRALHPGFEMLVLAPVLPLGAHSAIAAVDQNKVVATIRGSEVAADPTNALALDALRDGNPVELADGGFVDWAEKLLGSRSERMLISGTGIDRLAVATAAGRGARAVPGSTASPRHRR